MEINKGYKYRIHPNTRQATLITAFLGCCRFAYNYCLALREEAYASEKRSVSQYECMRTVATLRHDGDHIWLAACDSMALQEAVKDLNRAFQNFFSKRTGYPKFRSKRDSFQSYRTRNQGGIIRIEGNRINLPKLGFVKASISRLPEGRILNATVSKTPTGKYFVSLCVEEELVPKPNADGRIGIDLGIKDFYTDSNGNTVANPKALSKYERKLRREQRRLSRKQKGSSNRAKQRIRVARVHEKVYNVRTKAIYKAAYKLVNENQVIAVESLNIRGMVRNHRLAKAISDASWGRFLSFLEYKAFEYGCEVVKIPTFYPSSQTCSSCGYKNPKVKDLKIRKWVCPECGALHDRDCNAAVNILKVAFDMPTI